MDQLISSGGISQVALAFFTALFGMVSYLIKMVYDTKGEARNAKDASVKAVEGTEQAITNTKNVSNGFAGEVLGQLSEIRKDVENVSKQMSRHMEWHLNREEK